MRRKDTLVTTAMALALAASPLAALSAAEAQGEQQQTAKGEQAGQENGKIDLALWHPDRLYDGWTAQQLIDTEVVGPTGEAIGEIENVVVSAEGRASKVIVEVGGFLDIGDTHVAVPWQDVEFTEDLASARVPVTEENIDQFSVFEEDEPAVPDGERRAWRVTEFVNDYVSLQDFPRYGVVQDLVFARDGTLDAVVVYPDVAYGVGGPHAYPYYGYEEGFQPTDQTYDLPYTRDEIAELGPFDYEAMGAPAPGAAERGEGAS